MLGPHDARRAVHHAGLLLQGGKEDRLFHLDVARETAGELPELRGGRGERAAFDEAFDGGEDRVEPPMVATEEVRHVSCRSLYRRVSRGYRRGRGLLKVIHGTRERLFSGG